MEKVCLGKMVQWMKKTPGNSARSLTTFIFLSLLITLTSQTLMPPKSFANAVIEEYEASIEEQNKSVQQRGMDVTVLCRYVPYL